MLCCRCNQDTLPYDRSTQARGFKLTCHRHHSRRHCRCPETHAATRAQLSPQRASPPRHPGARTDCARTPPTGVCLRRIRALTTRPSSPSVPHYSRSGSSGASAIITPSGAPCATATALIDLRYCVVAGTINSTVILVLRSHRTKVTSRENRRFGRALCDHSKGHSLSTQNLAPGPKFRSHLAKYPYGAYASGLRPAQLPCAAYPRFRWSIPTENTVVSP